tara:strand:+ start:3734 stop:3925 length:192 start_codon:yes stop_codon:yes gene_type:complete
MHIMYGIKRKAFGSDLLIWELNSNSTGSFENVGPLLFPSIKEAEEYALERWKEYTVTHYPFKD